MHLWIPVALKLGSIFGSLLFLSKCAEWCCNDLIFFHSGHFLEPLLGVQPANHAQKRQKSRERRSLPKVAKDSPKDKIFAPNITRYNLPDGWKKILVSRKNHLDEDKTETFLLPPGRDWNEKKFKTRQELMRYVNVFMLCITILSKLFFGVWVKTP